MHKFTLLKQLSEIKKIMHTLCIIGDMSDDHIAVVADCMVSNLRTDECRAGCANCHLNELQNKLVTAHAKIDSNNGKAHNT